MQKGKEEEEQKRREQRRRERKEGVNRRATKTKRHGYSEKGRHTLFLSGDVPGG
jgi:hypothetical protein